MDFMLRANLEVLKNIVIPKIMAAEQAGDGIVRGELGEEYGLLSYQLYHGLDSWDNPITLSPWTAINRFRMDDGGDPDSVAFWSHPDAIVGLHQSCKRMGFYDGE